MIRTNCKSWERILHSWYWTVIRSGVVYSLEARRCPDKASLSVILRWKSNRTTKIWTGPTNYYSTLGVVLVSLDDSSSIDHVPLDSTSATDIFPRSLSSTPLRDRSSHPSYSNPLLGDFLALFSGLFYALWVTLLKVRVHNESRVNMLLFLGFVGAITMALMWPLGVILHFTGVEPFEWPRSNGVWTFLAINVRLPLVPPLPVGCVELVDSY